MSENQFPANEKNEPGTSSSSTEFYNVDHNEADRAEPFAANVESGASSMSDLAGSSPVSQTDGTTNRVESSATNLSVNSAANNVNSSVPGTALTNVPSTALSTDVQNVTANQTNNNEMNHASNEETNSAFGSSSVQNNAENHTAHSIEGNEANGFETNEYEPERSVFHSDLNEEYGAEIAPTASTAISNVPDVEADKVDSREQEGVKERTGGQTVGWIGLVLAIASMFIYPALLGTTAVVLGIISYVQGSRGLGGWSAVIGGIVLIAYFVLVPRYT